MDYVWINNLFRERFCKQRVRIEDNRANLFSIPLLLPCLAYRILIYMDYQNLIGLSFASVLHQIDHTFDNCGFIQDNANLCVLFLRISRLFPHRTHCKLHFQFEIQTIFHVEK